MNRQRSLCLAAFLLAAAPAHAQTNACGDRHLATIRPDGSVARGSKDRVRQAMEDGLPIRVGWTLGETRDTPPVLSHWTDASFLSAFEGEVFAQIRDIERQTPVRGEARIVMPAGRQRWTGIIATNGRLEGHFDDGSEPTSTRVGSTWCVDGRR